MGNTYLAVLWMPIRFFVGHEWIAAGEHKLRDSTWMDGGAALQGYWERAVAIPEAPARPAITFDWFRDFLQYMLDNEWYTWFAKAVAIGEFLIGLGLLVGALVGIAAFFGTLLNFSFLLAGTTSTNPVLFGLGVFLVLGWKVAGWIGLDRFLLPLLGTPWNPGAVADLVRDKDAPPQS
jgi:thiosulfate dehydrogenase [quinone] large subunit